MSPDSCDWKHSTNDLQKQPKKNPQEIEKKTKPQHARKGVESILNFFNPTPKFFNFTPFIVGLKLVIVVQWLVTLEFYSSWYLYLLTHSWNLLCNWHGNTFFCS